MRPLWGEVVILFINLFCLIRLKVWRMLGFLKASWEGVEISEGARISPRARIARGVRLGKVEIGSDVIIGEGTYINGGLITAARIGRYCSIAAGVVVGPADHDLSRLSTSPLLVDQGPSRPPTVIGDDVWIGSHVTILRGVVIGDGAVIGAGAVVIHDVQAYSVVGGVPAKILRKRFGDPNEEQRASEFIKQH